MNAQGLRLMRATAANTSVGDTDRAAAEVTVRQATVGKQGVYLVMRVMWQAALGMLNAAGCLQDISRKRYVITFEKDGHGDRREPVSSERFRNWMLKSVFGLNPQGSLDAQRRVSDQYASRIAQVLLQAQSTQNSMISESTQSSFNLHDDRTVQEFGEGDTPEETPSARTRSKRKHRDGNDGGQGAEQDSARASSPSMPIAVPGPKDLRGAPAGFKTSEPRLPHLKIDMVLTSQP
jgi:hypothetical protein